MLIECSVYTQCRPVPYVRTLSAKEMQVANFPVDIGGDYFDRFKSYKNLDGSLTGIVCLKLDSMQSNEVNLAKFNGPANGVTRVTDRQKSQVEFLLLAHIMSIPNLLSIKSTKMRYLPDKNECPGSIGSPRKSIHELN